MINQYAEEKRWVFSFDLKEESDVACPAAKGRDGTLTQKAYMISTGVLRTAVGETETILRTQRTKVNPLRSGVFRGCHGLRRGC